MAATAAAPAPRAEDRRIRALRPAKAAVDPWHPLGALVEAERTADGRGESALTVFLAGAECPFTCVFCDLWRSTLDGPTPRGAVPAQLRRALAGLAEPPPARLKLYNASNFFDPRAVPPEDDAAIADLAAPFARVVVECHPRLVGARCAAFAARLAATLEVAMGVETVHPAALARLNKRATLDDLARAADFLAAAGLPWRAFVLVGAPFVPAAEAAAWAVESVRHAFALGAERAALIPVRGGNGELERLRALGEWTPPTLADLEAALDAALPLPGIVAADLWDVERLAACPACAASRLARLGRINRGGAAEPRVACAACGAA